MANSSDEVFHLNGDKITPMPSRPLREGMLGKTLENALQTLFEKHPQVIPGKQIDPSIDDPPRFVLLRREMPVGGWSLDHLFVDQRAILTLVETKLFQNPESRREIIGQIIEYAANAVLCWGNGTARQKAMEFWANQTPIRSLDDLISGEFGEDLDCEDFWDRVEENLRDNKIRLIIAADELRPEVRRMIEYLNREMQNAELLGLELKCYGSEPNSLVLVPRLVGQTQTSIDIKKPPKSIKWTIDKLKTAYLESSNRELGTRLGKILDWSINKQCFMTAVAIYPTFGLSGRINKRIFSFYHDGSINCFLTENWFPGGANERDALIQLLKELKILEPETDATEIISNRFSKRNLIDFSDDEFDQLLEVLSKFCK
jgi:hypothetical protein